MKLLIAYDASDCSLAALADLALAGLPARGKATILSVADVLLPQGNDWMEPGGRVGVHAAIVRSWDHIRSMVQSAENAAKSGAEKVRALLPGWEVEAKAIANSPSWGVLDTAKAIDAVTILLGSHGHGAVKRFLLGSVSQKVLTEAHCSVRIARPAPAAPPRVLLAVDGSQDSSRMVSRVAARNWPKGTAFEVLAVIDSQMTGAAAWAEWFVGQWMRTEDRSIRESAERIVADGVNALRNAGLEAAGRVVEGDPREAILQAADDGRAHTIFLGAHGLHHGPQRALGTVATAVATRAHCTVEIIR